MIKQLHDFSLVSLNTFGMRVRAAEFIEYDSMADFFDIEFESLPEPLLHIGGGSNLLFTGDFPGTVLHSAIKFITPLDDCCPDGIRVSVGAGVCFDDFCSWAASQCLWGVENLSHIPGEVGAAAVQNIGAYGVEVKDIIETVYCYDLEEEEFVHFDVSECAYGYRDSFFKKEEVKGRYIVTHVIFRLTKTYSPRLDYGHLKEAVENAASESSGAITPELVRNVVISIRKSKLPDVSDLGSAGSFFKNPVVAYDVFEAVDKYAKEKYGNDYKTPHYDAGDGLVKIPAAWLIEQCGWKGYSEGNVGVYEKQPLVIVNKTGKARPSEIIALENKIMDSVEDTFSIRLSPEVEHVNS